MVPNEIVPPMVRELAVSIQRNATEDDTRPYDITFAALIALPVAIVEIPNLTPSRINLWLSDRGLAYQLDVADRELHGCLLAYRSTGLIFIDKADPDRERRYTVAHEVAHFIVDYWVPRKRALAEFGPPIQAVLDGLRPPRLEERLDSVFLNTTIAPYICLLERSSHTLGRTQVWDSENRADQLAAYLLAPFDEVCREVRSTKGTDGYFNCRSTAHGVLTSRFGLPDEVARAYARTVADNLTGGMSALESWGL